MLVKSLKRQLYARNVCHKLVRASTDGRLFEPILAHLLHVLLGYYPRSTRGTRVEGHEVRPRLLQSEVHALRVWGLDSRHAVLKRLARRAPIAFKRKFHVISRDRFAVVELNPLTQNELVDQSVVGKGPRLGET